MNDLEGSPIEIAAVVVWQVQDTAEACFNVDDYENFVHVQSEAALRQLATSYPYDLPRSAPHLAAQPFACRSMNTCSARVQERLQSAGVSVLEARVSHLAYAPEIAAGDAAASAGRRDHRRPHPHRRRRGQHGANGSEATRRQGRGAAGPRARARLWCRTCSWFCAAIAQRSRS